jgi:hypothetical protein
MKSTLYTFIYLLALASASLFIHQAVAQQRAPSVSPLVEVEIGAAPSKGYDFSSQKRVPATAVIRQKENSTKYSYAGPILFFIFALPFAVWIAIAKKLKNYSDDSKPAYFSNVSQFTPYKTDYQKHDHEIDDDENDYPKSA